jgi:hypothetical protein
MKKWVLAATVLLVLAGLTAPSAQALPICFKWVQFCDGVQVNNQGLGGAEWYHWDCAQNSPMDAKLKTNGLWNSNCGTDGKGLVRSLAPNGPGDYYFVIDVPLDGTLDFHVGVYDTGTCGLANLQYNLLMGACTGIDGAQRSLVQ